MSLILEIGSGHNPDSRADILVDKFIDDHREREGRLIIDRPLIIADGEALPFRRNSFDYIIAKHVLEHSTEPESFLKEMERVGKGGYIETPNPVAEKLFNWPFHRWFVSCEDGELILKKKEETDVQFGNFFHLLVSSRLSVRIFLRLNHKLFNTCFEWKRSIPFKIISDEKTSDASFVKQMETFDAKMEEPIRGFQKKIEEEPILPNAIRKAKNLYRQVRSLSVRWKHRRYDFESILSKILCCPFCKDEGELLKEKNSYRCKKCGADYPVKEGVAIFNGYKNEDSCIESL
ncbi:MAG: methyltransferase domain-containing protein [Nitrospiria bacterium]